VPPQWISKTLLPFLLLSFLLFLEPLFGLVLFPFFELSGFCGFVGVVGFVGFVGFVGVVGFVGFVGFVGVVGFSGSGSGVGGACEGYHVFRCADFVYKA
jgi:hypothetical protein